jgi:putative endonuclease
LNDVGKKGELLAINYLIARGYEILTANYFNHKGYRIGEIDIIAKDREGEIVFVEVKARKGEEKDWVPGENISPAKIRKIIKTINLYLKNKGWLEKTWRIDLVGVLFNVKTRKASIRHFKAIRI